MHALSTSPEELVVTFIAILTSDLARYLIGAGGVYLSVNLLLSHSLRDRKIRSTTPAGRQLVTEILYSLRTVLVFACVGMSIWFFDRLGWLLLYRDPDLYGWSWFVASTVLLVLLHDCWFYWMHWLLHRFRPFGRFHVHHHLSHNPSPFTAYSFSLAEAVLTALYFPLALALVPVSEMAAFLFTAHMMLVNAVHHCGYEIYPRKHNGMPLLDWLTTTTHHDLHHANARWNFGLYFTHWDRWMGTEHPHYHEKFSEASSKTKDASPRGSRRQERSLILCTFGLIVTGASLTALLQTPQASADEATQALEMKSIVGDWATEGYAFVVRLGPCANAPGHLCGKLLWTWKPNAVAQEARHRLMLQGFAFSNGYWRDGRLVHPQNGNIYRGKLRQQNTDTLVLQGCFAMLLCDSQVWRRLDSLPHITGFASE